MGVVGDPCGHPWGANRTFASLSDRIEGGADGVSMIEGRTPVASGVRARPTSSTRRRDAANEEIDKHNRAEYLRRSIRTLGINVVTAAEILGVGRDTVHAWMRGEGSVPEYAVEYLTNEILSRVTRVLNGEFDEETD